MRDRARLCIASAVALVVLATSAGCADIPSHGQIELGRVIRAVGSQSDVAIHQLPPVAQPGLAPVDVVLGFLRALVNADDDYEIARSYLTTHAAATWRTTPGVVTYDDSGVRADAVEVSTSTRAVHLVVQRRGLIDAAGRFSPQTGGLHSTFDLVRQQGEWRIDRLSRDVLLSTSDVERAFRLRTLYFLNRTRTSLVPEQVLLKPQPGLATALARAVLDGPGAWLAPAVRTSVSPGTQLLGNVPVDDAGTATVNLSGRVRLASPTQLKQLAAQLVWTLTQIPEVTSVRLLADGSTLAIPNAPQVQDRSTWVGFDPSPAGDLPAIFAAGGQWQTVTGNSAPGVQPADGLKSVVRASAVSVLAGLRVTSSRASLLTWRAGGVPAVRLSADTLTAPTTDSEGDVFTVATRGNRRWVAELTSTGESRQLLAAPALVERQVQDLRMSPDGSRVAAVVGSVGHGRLLVGRVVPSAGGLAVNGFRDVLTSYDDVRGVSWLAADELVVTAGGESGRRQLVQVDIDGYASHLISLDGLRGAPTSVAAAPRQPLVVVAGGRVWVQTPSGGWRSVGRGSQPSYAGG